MTTLKEYIEVILQVLLFLIIGWLLLLPLNYFTIKLNTSSSGGYIILEAIYMILAGILIAGIVNRKNFSKQVISFEKSSAYYRRLIVQCATWGILFVIMAVSEYFKLNYMSNWMFYLSRILAPENRSALNQVFFAMGIYVLPFLFITLMALAYLTVKYLFDKSTLEETTNL